MKTSPRYPINTFITFPDGKVIDFHRVTFYGNRKTPRFLNPEPTNELQVSGAGVGTYVYRAPSVTYALRVEAFLDSLPELPASGNTKTDILLNVPISTGPTMILLQDGVNLNMSAISSYWIDPLGPGPDWITFNLTTGGNQLLHAASVTQAQLTLLAIAKIVTLPGDLYVVSNFLPTFAALSLSPDNGPAAGGTAITVDGMGFEDGCTANLGGKAATVAFVNATQIIVTDPGGIAGTVTSPIIKSPDGIQCATGTHYTLT